MKDAAARLFYEQEALRGGWSVRQLDRQIGSLGPALEKLKDATSPIPAADGEAFL